MHHRIFSVLIIFLSFHSPLYGSSSPEEMAELFKGVVALTSLIDSELNLEGLSDENQTKPTCLPRSDYRVEDAIADIKEISAMIDRELGIETENAEIDTTNLPKIGMNPFQNRTELNLMQAWYQALIKDLPRNPTDRVCSLHDFFRSCGGNIGCHIVHLGWNHIFDPLFLAKYVKACHTLYLLSPKQEDLTIIHFAPSSHTPSVKRLLPDRSMFSSVLEQFDPRKGSLTIAWNFLKTAQFLEEIGEDLVVLSSWNNNKSLNPSNMITFLDKKTGIISSQSLLHHELGWVKAMSRFGKNSIIAIGNYQFLGYRQLVLEEESAKIAEPEPLIHNLSFSKGYRIATQFRDNLTTISASYRGGESILVGGEGRILSKPQMAGNILFYQSNRDTVTAICLDRYKKLYDLSVENDYGLIPLIMTDGDAPNIIVRLHNGFKHVDYDFEAEKVKESDILIVDNAHLYNFTFNAKYQRLWALSVPNDNNQIEVICWDMNTRHELIRTNMSPDKTNLSWAGIKILGFAEDASPIFGVEGGLWLG